ncbi:MAG: hypothetical protein OHK0029_40570 [Armatimonadaceae bacterium]
MIPDRLQLRNFMSYGEGVPPLDFAGIRLACLTGDNGNGKSAILDAMTWALFDRTRAKERDSVIRLGATEAAVLLDFYIEDVKYRVRRALSRKGGSVWELQVWQEDGTTRPLTGTSTRETGDHIRKLLRMDYETFLATGYLAQGRADEFTKATGSGRKKVLGEILGLHQYERLKEMANERRKEAEAREKDAERDIRALDDLLSKKDYYEDQLEKAQAQATEATAARDTLRQEQEALLAQLERLEAEEERARDFEQKIREADRDIADWTRDRTELEARVAQAQQWLDRRADIEDRYCRHEALSEEAKRLNEQYETMLALEREAQALEARIQDEYRKLDNERYRLETEIAQMEREGAELPTIDDQIAGIKRDIETFGDVEKREQEAETGWQKTDDEIQSLRTRHADLKAQCEQLQKRIDALSGSDSAICEYCGQSLPPAKRQQAIVAAEAEWEELQRVLQDVAAEGKDCKLRLSEWKHSTEAARADRLEVARLQTKLGQILQNQNRLTERLKELPGLQRRFQKFTQRIAEKDYAPAEQERRLKIAAELEKFERVAQWRKDVYADLERYKNVGAEMERLRQAQEEMEVAPPRIEELNERIAKKESSITKAQRMIEKIRERTGDLPQLYRDQATRSEQLRAAEEQVNIATRLMGEMTTNLQNCKRWAEERVQREAERVQAVQERDRYKELTAAFSDKGVQALIIGNALPELQNQTNELLSRMTNGAMQVQLLLQREAKTKGASPIETLDIVISDDLGTRPYEMFSGGEAFRINFALRVALSKLLARRAGAPLQTLILDEGFGTQDPRGREAIADAITTVADDFAVVLVITHIDELKETFPTRIEVVKGPGGSTFSVV